MKKVLLLGDSIRMGYDSIVKELLKDKCEVIYEDEDNGRFTAYTLWQANQLFKAYGKFDVVHWNNGYWDMNREYPMQEELFSTEEYSQMLRRIIKLCKANSEHIIFATTLPVGAANDRHIYDNDDVIRYNDAAKKVMQEEGVELNDLYSLMYEQKDFCKCEDTLHLTEEGYNLCAKQIAEKISKYL